MKPSPLRLARPRSLEEALALLAEHGDDAKVIAGGQSLVPLLNFRLAAPAVLVDLNRVPALAMVDIAGDSVRVGALCSQRDLERHAAALDACPLLRLALPFVGHVATRNRGTVGGSIAHADAAAELPLLLQTLAGEVEVTGQSGARLVPSEEFLVSHLTSCLEPDEIVTEVRFPVTGAGWGVGFAEVAPRHGDYAVCAVACALRVEAGVVAEARLGAGAVSDRPLRLDAAERALVGSRCEPAALESAAGDARGAVDPSDGMHASAEYRRHLTGVLARRASQRAYAMAAGVSELVLTVNGRSVQEHVDDRLLLSDFLRHSLGLRGTHVGCEHGVCGACTVQVDGRAVRSCLMLAVQAEGCHVETVESLAEPEGPLSALQDAFRRHHALQCGFCTPGILMSAGELLAEGGAPTRREIEELLSGHLCRCTGYEPIVDAIAEVAGTES